LVKSFCLFHSTLYLHFTCWLLNLSFGFLVASHQQRSFLSCKLYAPTGKTSGSSSFDGAALHPVVTHVAPQWSAPLNPPLKPTKYHCNGSRPSVPTSTRHSTRYIVGSLLSCRVSHLLKEVLALSATCDFNLKRLAGKCTVSIERVLVTLLVWAVVWRHRFVMFWIWTGGGVNREWAWGVGIDWLVCEDTERSGRWQSRIPRTLLVLDNSLYSSTSDTTNLSFISTHRF
jgi:hypothetical protein